MGMPTGADERKATEFGGSAFGRREAFEAGVEAFERGGRVAVLGERVDHLSLDGSQS